MKTVNLSYGYLMLLAGMMHLSGVPAASSNPDLPEGLPVVDGLSVYLDAESVESSGSRVTGMLDRTGNANDAREVGVIAPGLPVLLEGATPSGLNAVRFDGLGGYADVASNPDDFDGRAKTTFLVFRTDEFTAGASGGAGRLMNTAYRIIDSFESPYTQPHLRHRTSEIWLQTGGVFRMNVRNPLAEFIAAQTPDGSVSTGEFFIGVKEWRDNGDLFARIRNAANETFSGDSIGGMAEPEEHLHTRIGAGSETRNTRPTEFWAGDIAAVLIYNRGLSTSEREDVELYLHGAYLDDGSGAADPGEPPVVDGLILHLNGMNVMNDGDAVTELVDVSGRGNHATAFVHDPQPGLPTLLAGATPTGQDAVRFDGVGGYAEVPSNPEDFDGRAKTTIAVFRPEHLAGSDYITNTAYEILDPSLDPGEQSGLRTRTNSIRAFGGTDGGNLRVGQRNLSGGFVGVSTPAGSIRREGEYLIGINQWRANGDLASIVRDNQNERFESVGEGADAEPSGHINTRLGGTSATGDAETPVEGEFFEGEIAAFLIYNRELSGAELESVETYLYDTYLGSGQGEPGDPPVTEGLVLHLNGANVVANGDGTVSQLVDISGRGNHAETFVLEPPREGGPTLVPSGAPSGKPTVRFDGRVQYLEIGSSPEHFDGRSKTSVVVFNAEQLSDGRLINSSYSELAPGSSPSGRTQTNELRAWDNGNRLRANNRGPGGEFVGVNTPMESLFAGEFFIGMNQWRDNGELAAILIGPDNERFEAVTDGATADPAGHVHTRIGAGTSFGGTTVESFFPGEIAAVLIYNRELSAEELEDLETYLFEQYMMPSGVAFADWIAGFDVPPEASGPDDDASGDGVSNLLKYAIGGDPTETTLAGLPLTEIEVIGGNPYLVLEAHKNPAAMDLSYLVEMSTDLINWNSDPENVVILEEDTAILRARLGASLGEGPRAFIRLRVTLD